ncbi:glycosyltransferase family A protein [Paraburkholderia sp. J67]|uniref:glycosyltransferase family A protein n=1 Tax=Paraburkholderia sp. J67 TaxID=2805435 RepID=UPI002ABE522D|nr:glycosyltransferase family A protein [Paraburkholderia sp. J67]
MRKVSVYIPTKNRLNLLKRSLSSVFNQTYDNVEILVADDGSTDGSREYLLELEGRNLIKLISMPTSMGACVARNFAISASSGDFITGLDDDDYFLPDRISNFINSWDKLSKNNERVAGIFSPIRLMYSNREKIAFTEKRITADRLRKENCVGSQIFAPRSNFFGAGLFDPAMPCWQDWDMWLRIADRFGCFVNSDEMSYVWDMTDPGAHISNKPEFAIRYGYQLFMHKAGVRGFKARVGPIAALSHYSQVSLSASEFSALVLYGQAGRAFRYAVKKTLGEERVERLRAFVEQKRT